ncbi:hypothetical protein DB31_5692 [Hyalangium minutum]|uniref:Uncharacterized protein n=1 Tax=Hyalangium minutum TaxID=394096 RepID=A0A085WSI7_9BACT|nr:hypothetical protein DB31_5692 [Hyalangium minutum]
MPEPPLDSPLPAEAARPYEAQRQFGLRVIENIQKGIW